MARINDLQAGFQKTLALSYGEHVVQGHSIQHIEEFVGNDGEKQITLYMALGDGAPDEDGEGEWDGVAAVYYRGRLIDPSNYHFHSGKLSTGEADPNQGVDSFFPGGITYSGTPSMAIRLPVGVADEADPSGLDIIVRTSKIADYDVDGNVTEISYSVNPARVKANMIKRRGQLSRIDWADFVHARDWYDFLLNWESGSATAGYSPFSGTPTLDIGGPISPFGAGGVSKAGGAADAWDNYAATVQVVRATNEDGYFKVVVGQNTHQMGMNVEITPQTPNAGVNEFGVAFGDQVFWICYDGICYAPLPYDGGDSFKIAIESDEWKLYQNDVEVTLNGPTPMAPAAGPLYGVMRIWEHGGIFVSSDLEGFEQTSSTPTSSQVPRFEAHPAFTGPVDINRAIDYVDFLTCSDTQDAGAKIKFLTPEPRTSCHTFTEGVNCRSVRIYEIPPEERPNRVWAEFRNLDLQYLEKDEVSDSRDDLYEKLGYTVDPGPLNFASMNGSQAQRLIRFLMRRRSGRQETVGGVKRTKRMYYAELIGFQDSYHVLQADVVTGLFEEFGLAAKEWLVLRATRESPESTANERRFVLQEYADDDYRDTDHGAQQAGSGVQPTSPFAPPGNPFLTLDQQSQYGIGGTLTTKIIGTVSFPAYSGRLRAKIYVTPPGGVEEFTGQTVAPAVGQTSGRFEYIAEDSGLYTFRAAVESASGAPGGDDSKDITVANQVIAVPDPESLTITVSGQQLLYTIEAPATSPEFVDHYEISKTNVANPSASDIVFSGSSLQAAEAFSGTLTLPVTRYVRAVDAMGNKSDWVTGTYSGASLAAPTLSSLTSSGSTAEFSVTPNVATNTALIAKTVVEVATSGSFGGSIVLTREFTGMAPTTGPITLAAGAYYIRARYLDAGGVAGTNSTTETFTLTAAGGGTHLLIFEFIGANLGTDPLTTGVAHAVIASCPYAGEITEWYIKEANDVSGSCTIDLWKDQRGNATPDSGDSITGTGTKPNVSSGFEATGSDFTDWSTTSIAVNDEIRAVLQAVTNFKHLYLYVKIVS